MTTDASGAAGFNFAAPSSYLGQAITGTATPFTVASGTFGSTSEFGLDHLFSDLVTTTGDSGAGSLRQAILDADASPVKPIPDRL